MFTSQLNSSLNQISISETIKLMMTEKEVLYKQVIDVLFNDKRDSLIFSVQFFYFFVNCHPKIKFQWFHESSFWWDRKGDRRLIYFLLKRSNLIHLTSRRVTWAMIILSFSTWLSIPIIHPHKKPCTFMYISTSPYLNKHEQLYICQFHPNK